MSDRQTIHQRALLTAALFTFIATTGVFGCSDDTDTSPLCNWIVDPSDCDNAGGETGVVPDDIDDDAAPPTSCTTRDDGYTRSIYQCEGLLEARIEFKTIKGDCANTLGDPVYCKETHRFGVEHEPYEAPAVMACCDPEQASDHDVLSYCAADMVEQICNSIPPRLQKLIDDGNVDGAKVQARALMRWISENRQACYNALYKPSDQPGVLQPATWLVKNNIAWLSLTDFAVSVSEAQTSSYYLPEVDDQLACRDNSHNDTEVFEARGPIAVGVDIDATLTEPAGVVVDGPVLFGARVLARALVSAGGEGARSPQSVLRMTQTEVGSWVLRDLDLYAQDSIAMRAGDITVTVDRGALRLYGGVHGQMLRGNDGDGVVLEPGSAPFLISGVSELGTDLRWARNATPVVIRVGHSGEVFVESFIVEHVQQSGETWRLNVPATKWAPPRPR